MRVVRLVHRRDPRIAPRPPRVGRRNAGEVPVDPGGRPGLTGSWVRLGEVDLADRVQAIDDIVLAIGEGRAQRHRLADERSADVPDAVFEGDLAVGVDLADDRYRCIFDRWQLLREGAIARLIARGWRRQLQRLVRPLGIIDMAPGLEGLVSLLEVAPSAPADHFGFERTVESLILALGLRMTGTPMADTHA